MTSLWTHITDEGRTLLAHLAPFARQVAADEVTALSPLAREALIEVTREAGQSGSLKDFAAQASATLTATAAKAEAAGVQAAGSSLLAAVGGALAASAGQPAGTSGEAVPSTP